LSPIRVCRKKTGPRLVVRTASAVPARTGARAVRADPDLRTQAEDECAQKRAAFDKQVRAAYQHVVWLSATGEAQRDWADHRIEADDETSLNGSHVWRVLEGGTR